MVFKSVFLALVPDAQPEKHRSVIETGKYQLFTVLVKDPTQALEISSKLVEEENVHSILLCPGFTHQQVAEIAETVGERVGVSIARGDGPSREVSIEVMNKEGWFPEKH